MLKIVHSSTLPSGPNCLLARSHVRGMIPRRTPDGSGVGGADVGVRVLGWPGRGEVGGRYADTTRENLTNTMGISGCSFTEIAKRAAELMPEGGSLLTLTYGGSTRWVPSYNVMGVAKAALEASVRYLAVDYGPPKLRVNALSA